MDTAEALLPAPFPDFIAQWHRLRPQGATMPTLSRYFDTAIPAIQPWVAVVDVQSHTVRLMGTALVTYFGTDATGGRVLDLLAPQTLDAFARTYDRVPVVPCGAYIRGRCSTSSGRDVESDNMALPYATRDGSCIVWLLKPAGNLGFTETGFQITAILSTEWIDLGYGVPADGLDERARTPE